MVNYPAIHAAYQEYKGQVGNAATPVPQPEQRSPMHNLVIHAMAMHPNEEGETHQSMIIRALSEHLKRTTPDVSSIHKAPATPSLADPAPLMGGQ